jgi:mediator of RNA polymerase II transcription subunit 19
LGKKPSVFQGGTFYLTKEPPEPSELTGLTNLMSFYGLEHSYHKFTSKKVKDELSAFLPNLPGNIDAPGTQDNSSLRSIIEKPPITGKELIPLAGHSLSGFRLHPGPLAEQYRIMSQPVQKKKRHKKHKKEGKDAVLEPQADNTSDSGHDHRKPKKAKRTDEERKKRKKEKKKKKEKEKEDKVVFSPMMRPT